MTCCQKIFYFCINCIYFFVVAEALVFPSVTFAPSSNSIFIVCHTILLCLLKVLEILFSISLRSCEISVSFVLMLMLFIVLFIILINFTRLSYFEVHLCYPCLFSSPHVQSQYLLVLIFSFPLYRLLS